MATAITLQLVPLFPEPAYAFKARTHLWVGQQVLNDVLPDGRVTIAGREYLVPAYRVQALRANPDAYRMGHIGPDAHPDLLVGQSVIHPGDPWPVDSWLRHLVTQAGQGTGADVAYAFGFLGHAAGDIWAHSYVNVYTGSVFDLTEEGLDGEIRHIALEAYIDEHIPDIVDASGRRIETPEKAFDAPHDFLRDELIFSSSAAAQYNQRAEVSAHLIAMRQFRLTLGDLQRLIEQLASPPAELERALRRAALETSIKLNDHLGILAQQRQRLQLAQEALRVHQQAIAAARQAVAAQERAIAEADAVLQRASGIESGLNEQKHRFERELIGLAERISRTPTHVAGETCRKVRKWLPWPLKKWTEKLVCDPIQVVNTVYERLIQERSRVARRISDIDRELNDLRIQTRDAAARRTAAVAARTSAMNQLAALEANTVANAAVESAVNEALEAVARLEREQDRLEGLAREAEQQLGSLLDLRNSLLTGAISLRIRKWQHDVDRAILAYEEANTEVMRGLVGSGDPLAPLKRWAVCWGPVFMSVPSEIPVAVCGTVDIARNGIAMIQETRAEVADRAGDLGWVIDPGHKLEELVDERLRPELVAVERHVLTQVAGPRMSALVTMLHEPVDETILNAHFATDGSGTGILLIPDMAARADSDMHVRNGRFDPARFGAAANAVTLAKLALLDAAGMRELLTDLGVPPNEVGEVQEPFNVLFGTARSIDGSHQWIGGPAPDYPRRNRRGSGFSGQHYGMRAPGAPGSLVWLFSEQHRRDAVFEVLFVGPVAPSLEWAAKSGFAEILPRGYPRGIPGEPFVSYTRSRCYLVLTCERWAPEAEY